MIDTNEVENFSRADGRTQEKFALRKLGKILKQRKNNVLDVLRQEGIRVPKKARPRFIIKAIRKNARNRRLMDKLAIMMLWDSTLDGASARARTSGFIGTKADGSARLFGSGEGLQNLFKKDPNKTKGAGWEKLGNFFKGDPNKEKKGGFFGTGKTFGETKFGTGFNNMFKGGVDTDGNKTKSKFGDFLSNNSDNLTTLAGSLFGGLFNKGGEEQVADSYENTNSSNEGGGGGGNQPQNQGIGMGKILLFGAIAIGGIVAIYFASKGKAKIEA